MVSKIRVAILEDHQSTIDGYLYRLKDLPQFEVVGTVAFGVALEPLLAEYPADIAILDVSVPTAPDNPNPYPILHVIPELLEKHPSLSILVISMLTERALIQAVIDAGASGYILKDDSEAIRQLGSILQSVASGGMYLSEQARQQLFKHRPKEGGSLLTRRQIEVLSLCAAYPDESLANLAANLGVSNSTVCNLLSGAYLRLEVSHRAAAVARARQLGLLAPADLSSVPFHDPKT
ncbi:MAG TPA: response regulator transcription factor [Anaerolineae bacterium]|nr:response regulator transcription factor [Anaerolineae bacterium]